MKFSIVIACHGDPEWSTLAMERAYPSASSQGAHEVLFRYTADATRAEVRNRLTDQATGDYIITLDADDELAPGYVTAMQEAIKRSSERYLLVPAVSYVRNGKPGRAKLLPTCALAEGNYMVVGTAFPKKVWEEVGGWRTFTGTGVLNEWDDWDLWIRCVKAECVPTMVPDAIYVAHVRNSPHHSRDRATTQAWLQEIREANGL